MTAIDSAIQSAISPIVADAGLFLEALQISSAGKHRIIRVLVDHMDPDTPLSLDEVTAVTKPISARLDELPELGERSFTLEVSSPGVDFPLTLPRHWAKNKGRLVAFTSKSGQKVSGRIVAAGTDSDSVIIESKKGEQREYQLKEIGQANIEIEFK